MSIRQINITAEQPPIDLYIGRVAENEVTGVEFDLTPWIQTYGEGAATIVMKRWGDTDPYPVALEIDENGKAEYYRRQSQYFGWSLSERFIPNRDLPKFVQIELKGDLRSGLLDATVITKSGMKMTGTVVVYKK